MNDPIDDGDPTVLQIDLTNCDKEPIHRLGHIQPFGLLLAADEQEVICHASSDLERWIGIRAEDAVGQPLSALIMPDTLAAIRIKLDAVKGIDAGERCFGLQLREGGERFDFALHVSDGLMVIEAERSDRSGITDTATVVRFMVAHLDQAASFADFCRVAAERVRALLGYDRVMVYRFDDDLSGEVVAEAARPDIGSFLGHHYPAADIPAQARLLYQRNWLRIIADVDAPPVRIVGGGNQAPVTSLDLSLAVLRAVSPVHLEYLRNMGVHATLSISIIVQGRLWGLFACHHYAPHLVGSRPRTTAELFGQMFSLLLEARERREEAERESAARAVQDRIMARIAGSERASSSILRLLPEIADAVPADGIALALDQEVALHGRTPDREAFLALIPTLRREAGLAVLAEETIANRHPAAAAWAQQATGMLVVPLSRSPRDYLVFFRREYARTVTWAGEPAKHVTIGPLGPRLTPRESFEAWRDVVRGRSAPWTPLDIRIAEALRVGLLEVILRLADRALEQRRLAAERQKLLIAELNHRVRNILALIAGLVVQSADNANSVEQFAGELEGRVHALARAHDQITRDAWGPAPLRGLLATETEAYLDGRSERVRLAGPEVLIAPAAFATLALVVHELVTNSAKYGALGAPAGHVEARWALQPDGGLAIDWSEHGGPPVQPPQRQGFGSTFIERAVPHDLRGEATITFAVTGLRARFVLPPDQVARVEVPAAAPVPEPAAAAPRPLTLQRALVVDDSLIVALDAQATLMRLGVPIVDTASSVAEAMVRIGANPPDFALLDLNLGRETSFPIAAELDRRGIPYAFATGYGDDPDILGAYADRPVLRKPYARDAVRRLLPEV
jgi:light-regulated signal transduction histidine kinase (bacteriophytochrome)